MSAAASVGLPAEGPVFKLIQTIDAQDQALARTVFHALLNWTATLPVNPVTDWLEGGLLMVRKSLFNQTVGIHSVQTLNSPMLVTGKVDVIDPDGDGWKVELVSQTSHGTVVLGNTSQTDGIGATKYTYTPGDGYAGKDEFVVKVTSTDPGFNILDPFGLMATRYYTVAIGDAAEVDKGRFNAERADPKDVPDTHLFLSSTAATITVKKQGWIVPNYTVSVKLSAETAAKSFAWMDTRGNMGSIPVDTMLTQDWGAYAKKAAENGVKPLLTFKYSDQGGEKAVFVDVSSVTKNADGTYTLSVLSKTVRRRRTAGSTPGISPEVSTKRRSTISSMLPGSRTASPGKSAPRCLQSAYWVRRHCRRVRSPKTAVATTRSSPILLTRRLSDLLGSMGPGTTQVVKATAPNCSAVPATTRSNSRRWSRGALTVPLSAPPI